MANRGKRSGNSYKNYYAAYNYTAQKRKRLERHINKFPEDEQAVYALENLKEDPTMKRHQRSKKPGGWINPRIEPWASLSTKEQPLMPKMKSTELLTQNQKEEILGKGLADKKRFAYYARKPHGFQQRGAFILKQAKKEKLGWAHEDLVEKFSSPT